MECTVVFKCECNGKSYPSESSLKAHKKTKGHIAWENTSEVRKLKIMLTERDNDILKLKDQNSKLRELNTVLVKRISIEQ
jgi:hypothetical protein